MGYTNNRTTAVHTKITNKGREKIATGNLNLAQWSIGDSEINYEREDYNYDNGITNSPARILKAVDMQPTLKYLIRDINQKTKFDLTPNDIKVAKYTLSSEITNFGVVPFASDSSNKVIFDGSLLNSDRIDNRRIRLADNYQNDRPKAGDIVIIKFNDYYITYKIESITNNIAQLDRDLIPSEGSLNKICIIPGSIVGDVPMWNDVDIVEYYGNWMEFENSNGVYNPVMDLNILTYEDLMGYFDKNITKGYEMIGFMENYLSYNDELNSIAQDDNPCAVDVVVGEKDKFQRFIAIAHYTNENRSNIFGDFFHIDHSRNKAFKYQLPSYLFYVDRVLTSVGDMKLIIDTDIEYYDLVGNVTGRVVGKVLPQLKMVIFDDHELITLLSTASGRNFELPMINSELITSENGVLEAGKQMYISYAIKTPNNSFPCQNYNVVKNTTTTAKDVKLLLPTNNTMLNQVNLVDIVYQITEIGERPKKDQWVTKQISSTNTSNDIISFSPMNTKKLVIDSNFVNNSNEFNLIRHIHGNTTPTYNIFGNETVLLGGLNFYCGSNTYRSTITINVNPNLMVDTTNPTFYSIRGVRPYITFSEIGIYDKDGDLVMISKVTRPITLTSNSTIRVEIGLDF